MSRIPKTLYDYFVDFSIIVMVYCVVMITWNLITK